MTDHPDTHPNTSAAECCVDLESRHVLDCGAVLDRAAEHLASRYAGTFEYETVYARSPRSKESPCPRSPKCCSSACTTPAARRWPPRCSTTTPPAGQPVDAVREIRDQIDTRVRQLLTELAPTPA